MQCNWFEMAMAKAYLRLGRVGDALKKCHQIDKVTCEGRGGERRGGEGRGGEGRGAEAREAML